jgi:alpha-galactosidase
MAANVPRLRPMSDLLKVRDGQLTMFAPGPEDASEVLPLLCDCWAGVELGDGTQYTTREAGTLVEEREGGVGMRLPGSAVRPELRWSIMVEQAAQALMAHLWLEVENTTSSALPIGQLNVLVAPGGFRGVAATGLDVAQTGWQSWSYATPPVPLADHPTGGPAPVFSPMGFAEDGARLLVPWVTVLQARGAGTMLAGFTTARDLTGILAIEPGQHGHHWVAFNDGEGVLLARGATRRSETLLLIFDQPYSAALAQYAAELGANMAARRWPHVPSGWCSWYQFFTEVSEADILRNLEQLDRERAHMPLEYMQIDDGYQQAVGDWLDANDKFPAGMRSLAGRIRERGFKPGIWLAPFIAHERSRLYAEHADWLLHDPSGAPVVAMWNWESRNYALDITHPEVEEWLRRVVHTMVQEWGYEYLKIDFIYAAALRGRRHDPSCTSVQAYRRALTVIREVAPHAFVLGCGAPLAPSVGLVDGMRIGPDVARYWRGAETEFGFARGLHRAVRSTLAHLWTRADLWVSDPDCLLLHDRASDLTPAEVQAWTSLVALSGGMVLLSDDLAQLAGEPTASRMITRALPPYGEAATAFGATVDGIATCCRLAVHRPWEQWLVAALFNWTTAVQATTLDPAAWDLPAVPFHLYDLWSGEHWGPLSGPVDLGLTPPHGVRLLAVHTDRGRPQLVGSSLHVLGGPVELADEAWSGNRLVLELACPGRRVGHLVIYVPPGFSYIDLTAQGAQAPPNVQHQGRLIVLTLGLTDRARVIVQFSGEGSTTCESP